LETLSSELEGIKLDYKDKMKPRADRVKQLIICLKNKAESIYGECYAMKTDEEYCIYNDLGELVSSRPLRPSERQKTIHMALRDGTNQ
jgi:hypothetical protein